MTDCERIIEYMKTHKGITVAECRDNIGTTELRKRICDLKNKGYKIIDFWEEGVNRVGHPTRFKRYYLIQGGNDGK
jgi:hypothetical protein